MSYKEYSNIHPGFEIEYLYNNNTVYKKRLQISTKHQYRNTLNVQNKASYIITINDQRFRVPNMTFCTNNNKIKYNNKNIRYIKPKQKNKNTKTTFGKHNKNINIYNNIRYNKNIKYNNKIMYSINNKNITYIKPKQKNKNNNKNINIFPVNNKVYNKNTCIHTMNYNNLKYNSNYGDSSFNFSENISFDEPNNEDKYLEETGAFFVEYSNKNNKETLMRVFAPKFPLY